MHTVFQKGIHQTYGSNSVNSQPIFKFFHRQILQQIFSKILIKDVTASHMRRYITL